MRLKKTPTFGLALLPLSIMLVACGKAPTETSTPTAEQPVVEAMAPKAEIGSFGVDLSARDESVRPGDDFFMYSSGTWYDNYEMPADKSRYGAFAALADRSRDQVKTLIDGLADQRAEPGSERQMVRDFYASYMNIDGINALGIAALEPMLAEIDRVEDLTQLTTLLGRAWALGIRSPISSGMGFDRTNPDAYQLNVSTGGLGLPDRDYYLVETERFAKIRAAYVEDIAAMLVFAGATEGGAQAEAEAILALETQMAEYLWPREKRRNRDLTLNQIARADLSTTYPGIDWDAFIDAQGYVAEEVNVSQPDALQSAIALLQDTPIEQWQSYLRYHLVANHAGYLSDEIYQKHFEFAGMVLGGQKEPEPRWKRGVNAMSGTRSLGFAIGKLYVDEYFPESSKEQMSDLVANLRVALKERIENLDWMGDETRVEALDKLAAFRPKIGYPDVWPDLAGVTIAPDNLVGNLVALREYWHADQVAKEQGPTDRERWGMAPQRVNAYYNSSFNEIVFPAAILQPPFFDPNADPAVNYGAIGAVIGHEMGHGFDDQGSKSDAKGVQRNWWTDEDRAAFEERTDMLVAQYSAYEPIPGNFVNGQNSLGENIGDVGGLAMAYHAYRLSLNGEEAPVIDGVTGDQRFFLAWAQVWREKRTEQSMLSALRGGTHSPGRYRAQAPRNHDAWYEAFDVQPGDELYLAPEERVRIW